MKYNHDGSISQYKVRLVGQGFLQVYEIDFDKTFLSTVRCESLQIFLAMSYMFGLLIKQIDIVGAYLESLLSNNNLPILISLSPGFCAFRFIQDKLVYYLICSFYGLR